MIKRNRSINLKKESAKQLEAVGEQLRSKWLGHIARDIFINIVVTCGILIIFCSFLLVMFLAQDQTDIPKFFLDLNVIGFCVIFGLFVIFAFVYILSFSIKRLRAGPPKAGITPEDTIEKYFEALVPTNQSQRNFVDAYVCLLDQCKESFGGYDNFVSFWKKAKKSLSEQITKSFEFHKVDKTNWTLGEFEVEKGLYGLINYKIKFKVNAYQIVKYGSSGGYDIDEKEIGTLFVVAWISLAQVGDRWYVAKREWKPQLREIQQLLWNSDRNPSFWSKFWV